MEGHRIAEELARQFVHRTLNEADTRHQVINRLLHEVLSWPHGSVGCEQKVHPGYVDFVLRDKAACAALLIEAKREGKYFALPTRITGASDQLRYVRLRTLATDPAIADAVNQAAQYCPAIGCQYACVTNGHEFIIFRSFIPGKQFMAADALVIPSLQYFADRFTPAYNLLGYQAVTSGRSLQCALEARKGQSRELYYPKRGIVSSSRAKTASIWSLDARSRAWRTSAIRSLVTPCSVVGGRWSFFAATSDRSLSSSFIGRNWEGYCARGGRGRSLNYCACEMDLQRGSRPTLAGATLTAQRVARVSGRGKRFGRRDSSWGSRLEPRSSEAQAWYKPSDREGIGCCSLVFLLCCSCAPLVLAGPFRRLGSPFGPPPGVSWLG